MTDARLPAKQVVAVVAGNALQFYDFVTYAFFAAQIGRTFFPSDTQAPACWLRSPPSARDFSPAR